MKRYRSTVAVALTAGLSLTGAATAEAASTSAAAPTPGWRISLDAGPNTFFNDLAATGTASAWSAGGRPTGELDPSGTPFRAPVIRHWNGSKWTAFPTPAGPKGFPMREISLIEASSPANVWTAGSAIARNSDTRSVLSRWDGKRWRLVAPGRATVIDLDVVGPNTWAVSRDERNGEVALRHFRDDKQKNLPAPSGLRQISVRSPHDIWGIAAGSIVHWNGEKWRTVRPPKVAAPAAPLPDYGPVTVWFAEILTVGKKDVWIAARFQQGDWSQPGTALLRWNGKKWCETRLPKDAVRDLSGDGKGGFWAASDQVKITATPDAGDPYAYTTLSTDSLRYTGGRLTRQKVLPVQDRLQWADIVAVPGTGSGTGSALATGYRWRESGGAAVLRYGR